MTGGIVVVTDTNNMVDLPDLSLGRVDRTLEEVRSVLRKAGRSWAYWTLDADRPELIAALKARGLVVTPARLGDALRRDGSRARARGR